MPKREQWHEYATQAGFLSGVTDDLINEALKGADWTPAEIATKLDQADATLCTAMRALRRARAEAVILRDAMAELTDEVERF